MNAHFEFSANLYILFVLIGIFAVIFALVFVRMFKCQKISLNLIISSILQFLTATCLVLAICGLNFQLEQTNIAKEVVVLVDSSYSAKSQRENMDNFVYEILKQSVNKSKVGVVLFGHDQKIALNLTQLQNVEQVDQAFKQYAQQISSLEYDDATDINGALKFVYNSPSSQNFISDPQTARIIILSDGLQTDGDAISAVRQISNYGARVETSFYADSVLSDTSIIQVTYPEQSIYPNDKFNITLQIKSFNSTNAQLTLLDYVDEDNQTQTSISIALQYGIQNITFPYAFQSGGFHKLTFNLQVDGDKMENNNVFCSYYQVENKNKILILQSYKDEAQQLNSLLQQISQNSNIEVFIQEINSAVNLTSTQLAEYSEVILYNTACSDITPDFQTQLQIYVDQLGGGVFTVGGFEKDEQGNIQTAPKESDPQTQVPLLHSYKESDLQNSILADMLPVTFEAYKPAVAVVFIFDVSTSMAGSYEGAAIYTATEDARYIMDNVLDSRDYVGVVTLQDSYTETIPLEPMTKKQEIKDSFVELEQFWDWYASTSYAPAIQQASRMLANAPSNVARKHIVLFSDGSPHDSVESYCQAAQDANTSQDITLTVVTYYLSKKIIDGVPYYFNHAYDRVGYEIKIDRMKTLAGCGMGSFVLLSRDKTVHGVAPAVRKDLKLDQLEDICYESYHPEKNAESNILKGITGQELQQLQLDGYFPSKAKLNPNISIPIIAKGSPLYAEWTFGKGKVGSIFIDLEGKWSNDLLFTSTGKKLIQNIIFSLLMVVEQQNTNTFEVNMMQDNLNTQINVFNNTPDETDKKIFCIVQSPDLSIKKYDLGTTSHGSHFTFENSQVGIYTIHVMKVDANFDCFNQNILNPQDIPQNMIYETITLYRAFSYSKEFDNTLDPYSIGKDLLSTLSSRQQNDNNIYSKFVYDAQVLYEPLGTIKQVYDLRLALLISAMTLYIVGIIFRLFKITSLNKKSKQKNGIDTNN